MSNYHEYRQSQSGYMEDSSFEYDFLESDSDRERERARRRRKEERRRKRRREVMRNRIILGVIILALLIAGITVTAKLLKRGGKDKALVNGKSSGQNGLADDGTALVVSGEGHDIGEAETGTTGTGESENGNSENGNSENGNSENGNSENGNSENGNSENGDSESETGETEEQEIPEPADKDASEYKFFESESTSQMNSDEVDSTYCILTSVDNHSVVSARNAYDRISPASMTKVLTLLVACENIESLDELVTITIEATDYAYLNDGSAVDFSVGEQVPVRDLLYGTILPSGADAAYALACHVAGSHEAFVDMMNEKLNALGLADTAHFTNCAGLYDENHYCRAYDIAVIMEAAMENSLCREVLSAHRYTTASTVEHPDGINLSNLFLRRIEDHDTLGEVVGAKTGFVNQSRNCAVSYYTCEDGSDYICVTADGANKWKCINDHVAIYNIYAAGNTGYKKE